MRLACDRLTTLQILLLDAHKINNNLTLSECAIQSQSGTNNKYTVPT